MKNKLLALLAAIGMVASASAVEINDNLSIGGFIDGSYNSTEPDSGTDSSYIGIDEVEIDFMLNVGSVSGAVHLDDTNTSGGSEINIEQAHFTYTMDNGVSVTFGRYGSALGFERQDPAGLYTYSRAYEGSGYDLGNVDAASYEGIVFGFSGDDFSVAASIHESANANLETEDLNVELSASYTGMENIVVGGGYMIDNRAGSANERDIFNVHAAYSAGKALVAAEYISASDDDATAGEDAYMLLLDYDFNDKMGGAVRYSKMETTSTLDATKLTIAPNYAITDSLGAILEYSSVDVDTTSATSADYDYMAVELTYTF